jgi:hypothetical protein
METTSTIEYVKDSFDEYLSKKDHISASDIKTFLQSPAKYYYEKYVQTEKPVKAHFSFGSAMHEMILEPHLFDSNYMVIPKVDGRTIEGKKNLLSSRKNQRAKQ